MKLGGAIISHPQGVSIPLDVGSGRMVSLPPPPPPPSATTSASHQLHHLLQQHQQLQQQALQQQIHQQLQQQQIQHQQQQLHHQQQLIQQQQQQTKEKQAWSDLASTSNSEVGDSDQSLTSENDRNSDLTDIDMTLESLNRYHEEILEALQASGIAYGLTSMAPASDLGSETDLRGASGGTSSSHHRRSPGHHDMRGDGGASSSSSSSKKGTIDAGIYSEAHHHVLQQQATGLQTHLPFTDYGGQYHLNESRYKPFVSLLSSPYLFLYFFSSCVRIRCLPFIRFVYFYLPHPPVV